MTEVTLQQISRSEKEVQSQLDTLLEEKKNLERLTDEVIGTTGESVNYLHQLLQLPLSSQDYIRTIDLLDEMQGHIRQIEIEFDDRREFLLSQERKLTDQLDELYYQKRLELLRQEEEERKDRLYGQS